jgi:hypothetical protein
LEELRMNAISQIAVQGVIGPHHDTLAQCVLQAWTKWLLHIKPTLPVPGARGRANAVHEYMVNEARLRFGAVPGVSLIETAGRFLLGFPGMVVRFKKFDDSLKTRNYKTQTSLAFDNQAKCWLPGVPDVARITVGYRLNALGTEVRGVHVVLLHGERVAWDYEITPAASNVVQLPTRSRAPKAEPRVKGKKATTNSETGKKES